MRITTIGITALLAASSAAGAGDVRFEAGLIRWQGDLRFQAQLNDSSSGLVGDPFDAEEDLGVDSSEPLSGGQIFVGWGDEDRQHLLLSYVAAGYEGEETLSQGFQIGGTPLLPGERTSSSIDFALGRLYYGYSFFDTSKTTFGAHSGFVIVDIKGELRSSSSGTEEFEETIPFPLLGFNLDVRPHAMHAVHARVSGFLLGADRADGGVMEMEILYEFLPIKWMGAGVGYRRFGIDVDVEDESIFDIDERGLYLELGVRF